MSEPSSPDAAARPPSGEKVEKRAGAEERVPKADFLTLAASLAGQATIHLGLVEHPIAKKVQKDLRQARYTIDLLSVLEEKTRGNLNAEESAVLTHMLTDLRLRYIEASTDPKPCE